MYSVERAIVMAAGMGQRMRPLTEKIPKPLIEVNGKRMIDSIIEGLLENGIDEIYVVVGYLKEQFYDWVKEYDNIKIIENPYYETCNNISSLYVARDYIENSIILDGDQLVYNPRILNKEFEKSGYNCVWTNEYTNEWLLTVEDNNVKSCSRNGGKDGWQLYSVSRWDKETAIKLRKYLVQEFELKKNYSIYWDDIAMFCYPEEFSLGIFKMNAGDIVEIDSLEELQEIDSIYARRI